MLDSPGEPGQAAGEGREGKIVRSGPAPPWLCCLRKREAVHKLFSHDRQGRASWQHVVDAVGGVKRLRLPSCAGTVAGKTLARSVSKSVQAVYGICAGEGEEGQYQVAIETGEASNLSGSLAGLGFRSSEGVSPGRVLRVIHALVRTIFLAMGTKKAELAHADEVIEKVSPLFIAQCISEVPTKSSHECHSLVQKQHLIWPSLDQTIPESIRINPRNGPSNACLPERPERSSFRAVKCWNREDSW